jgi:hypothetical protein
MTFGLYSERESFNKNDENEETKNEGIMGLENQN